MTPTPPAEPVIVVSASDVQRAATEANRRTNNRLNSLDAHAFVRIAIDVINRERR